MLTKCGAGRSRETTLVLTIDGATKHGWSKRGKGRGYDSRHKTNSRPDNTQLGKFILGFGMFFFDIVLLDETYEVYFYFFSCAKTSLLLSLPAAMLPLVTGKPGRCRQCKQRSSRVQHSLQIIRQTCFHLHICTFKWKTTISDFGDFSP